MATTFQEGFSIFSPPLFKGFDYCFWRTRMIVFLNSINVDFVDILKNDFDLKRKDFDCLNAKLFHIILSALDNVVLSKVITNKTPKEIWSCLEFLYEGTNGDNKPQNDDMDECLKSRRKDDYFIHEEHECNNRCLEGVDHQEVSNSNSKSCEFTYDELLDAFEDMYDAFEKLILKNNTYKNQIASLSQQIVELNEKDSFKMDCVKCIDFQNENTILKEKVLLLEKDKKCMVSQISSPENKNVSLKEISSIHKNENEILKEKCVLFENENLILKKNNLKPKEGVCSTKFDHVSKKNSFPNVAYKRKDFSKGNSFSKQKYFSHGFSKKNDFSEKPILKQSLFQRFSKKKINFKKNDFIATPSHMQKCFSNKFVKNDVFENSKYACFHCNQNGHFIYSCPFKNKTYFGAKLIWVPKINPQGPEIKRVPKVI